MIILISGVSCTGKTLLAQRLLEKYHIPYISIDHIKMGLYRANVNCGFTPTDRDDVIAEKLWPILKGMIMTAIENKQSFIMEGCYILPKFISDFENDYNTHIISVFLGFSKNYIEENYESKIIAHRNVIERRLYPEDRSKEQVIAEHEEFKRNCEKHKVHYFEINEDYDREIQRVYEFIEAQRKMIESTKKKFV